MTVDRDNSASSEISRAKKDFYKQYSYLKPDCEKTDWEKFCEGLKKVGQWCKDHWKEIVLVIEIVVAVVCICVPGLQGIGTGILIGALKGALTGGLIGGITSMLTGGSFLEGFAQGALDGAIMGGALGGVGGIAGKFITCGSKLGNAIQTTSKISGAISNSMDGFDMVSLGLGMIDPNNPITELNNKMHQSDVYNKFQMGVSLVCTINFNRKYPNSRGNCIGERNITAEPPYIELYSTYAHTKILFNKKGLFRKNKNMIDFHNLQRHINEFGYTTLDLS